MLPVADTLVIGRLAAGAVLVVESRRTPVQMVNRAKAALIRNQTRILGVVLNQLRPGDDDAGYEFGYGEEGCPWPPLRGPRTRTSGATGRWW